MGFLRQRPDGTTSLNIITGEAGVIPGTEKDRPVLLGSLLGKVKQGTGTIQVRRSLNFYTSIREHQQSNFLNMKCHSIYRVFEKIDVTYQKPFIRCIMVHTAPTDQHTTLPLQI